MKKKKKKKNKPCKGLKLLAKYIEAGGGKDANKGYRLLKVGEEIEFGDRWFDPITNRWLYPNSSEIGKKVSSNLPLFNRKCKYIDL